jgi:hypothetical protein
MHITPGSRRPHRGEPSSRRSSPAWRLLCLLLVLASAACDSSDPKTFVAPAPARCAIEVKATATAFPAAGGAGTLEIFTARECTWTAQSDSSWVSLPSEASGQGDGSVRFTIAANAHPDGRAARLRVNPVEMAISQEGQPCRVTVSPTHESVGSGGGTRTINVDASHAQCTWAVTSDVPWITIEGPSQRAGSGEVSITVDAGITQGRSGTITLAGETVTVEQVSCTAVPSITALAIGPPGGRLEVPVTAPDGCPWTARSDIPWITLAGTGAARGNGTVLLDIAATSGPARTATISVAGGNIRIEQTSGCAVGPTGTTGSFTAAGGVLEIPVHAAAGCTWTARSDASWISIAQGGEGSGPGSVVLHVAASDGPARSAVVMVAGTSVTVTQASGCRYGVEPVAYSAAAGGEAATFRLQTGAGCPWTASSGDPWITLSPHPQAGPAAVAVSIAPNNGPSRTGSITIAGTTITVAQASPCTWSFAPPAVDYQADGGRGAVLVLVTGPCTWTAASTVSWIAVDAGSGGTGNGLVQFTVAANAGPARSGVIRIAGLDLVVRQTGR